MYTISGRRGSVMILRMYTIDSIAIQSVDDNEEDDDDVSILHNTE